MRLNRKAFRPHPTKTSRPLECPEEESRELHDGLGTIERPICSDLAGRPVHIGANLLTTASPIEKMETAQTNTPDSHDVTLRSLLKLRNGSKNILQNRENSQLEFKETFNLGSLAKYGRTMAAFADNRGGYIVFGVEPSPHRLKGVNKTKFEECDPAQVTQFLNAHFGPGDHLGNGNRRILRDIARLHLHF